MKPKTSFIDHLFSFYLNRLNFFHQGWGDPQVLSDLESAKAINGDLGKIEISWSKKNETKDILFQSGTFKASYSELNVPEEVSLAHIEFIIPKNIKNFPVCIHFPATGDEGFKLRRKWMAIPLAKKGIGSLILENPYYGRRRPKGQYKFHLRKLTDLGLMVIASVQEGRGLVAWLKQNQYGPIALTGVSMGGYISALVGSQIRDRLAVIPCLPTHSAESVFLEGVMQKICHWQALQAELGEKENAREKLKRFLKMSDLRNYPPPVETKACILVAAKGDAIVPFYSSQILHEHWKGSELRVVRGGHVTSFILHRSAFQKAIIDALNRLS